MNVPVDRKLFIPTARPALDRLDEAKAIDMGPAFSAVFVDRPTGRRGRMQAEQDGMPIPRPFLAAELALRSGGARHVLFIPQDIQTVLARRLLLRLDGTPVAEIDPKWLQLPQEALSALTAQLSDHGIRKLVRLILTTGASLFSGAAKTGLADAIPHLLDLCKIPILTPVARTEIAGRTLVSYPAPAIPCPVGPAAAIALLDGRLIRIKAFDCFTEDRLLHVLLPPAMGMAQIIAFPETPLRLAASDSAPRRIPIKTWSQGRSKPCGTWLTGCVGRSATAIISQDPGPAPTEPQIEIRHLSAGPGGVLYALVLQDPARSVRKVILERQDQRIALTPVHGADGTAFLTGLADMPGDAGHDLCQIHALNNSWRAKTLAQVALSPYDGSILSGFEEVWTRGADALTPLAKARAAFHRPPPPHAVQQFGVARKCVLRIVTSIGNSADMIRARAALIFAEDHNAPVEVVCTMAEGPLAVAARHALADTAAIYGIAHRLVLLPAEAHPSEHLRAALTEAPDVPALIIGGDVLPQTPGWLAFWLRRLRRQDALAAALLATDGAILASQEGHDHCKGLPVAHLPASGRVADRPLAEALAIAPAGIARLLAFGTTHPDPALWIAWALAGRARTETRFPFRRFGPAPLSGKFSAALTETAFTMIKKDRG